MKNFLYILVLLVVVVGIIFSIRFILNDGEDSWICQEGNWIKHGNPSSSMPEEFCAGGSSNQSLEDACGVKPSISINVNSKTKIGQDKITEMLLNKWFGYYKDGRACSDSKIKDFKINDIKLESQKSGSFVVNVSFDVNPKVQNGTTTNMYWPLENGTKIGEWIKNKSYFVTVFRDNDKYSLEKMEVVK